MAFAITARTFVPEVAGWEPQLSTKGLYRVSLKPRLEPVPIGEVHSWLVEVTEPQGGQIDVEVRFAGEMPGHGHGLSAAAEVTYDEVAERHIVEGVRFSMAGNWLLRVDITGPAGDDMAIFGLNL
ncbi:auxin-binding protein [Devosia albogilva]|uniref:Auxin-binding protein n=1 Tax=Devosia albogilva TaxID=429726 RepID=A0ABW5QIA9_9HYPH